MWPLSHRESAKKQRCPIAKDTYEENADRACAFCHAREPIAGTGYAEDCVRFNSLGSRACERTLGYETKLIPDTPKVLNNHASIV